MPIIYLDVFKYIGGSKIYHRESSFLFHSTNAAVINANDFETDI